MNNNNNSCKNHSINNKSIGQFNSTANDFPVEISLEEVRESIQGRTDFREIILDNANLLVFDYLVQKKDTFPSISPDTSTSEKQLREARIRRELRGLTFSKDGILLRRPFHKFFNLNEVEETLQKNVHFDPNIDFELTEKYDGSLVAPLFDNLIDKNVIWGTKKVFSRVQEQVQSFVSQSQTPYLDFARCCLDSQLTPLFEYISPETPLIIQYEKTNLILTAVRTNSTGEYLSMNQIQELTSKYPVPVREAVSCSQFKSLSEIIQFTQQSLHEGYVLRQGNMFLKLKSLFYMNLNRGLALQEEHSEKHLWIFMLEQKYDDLRPFISKDERKPLDEFYDQLIDNLTKSGERMAHQVSTFFQQNNAMDFQQKREAFTEFLNQKEHQPLYWAFFNSQSGNVKFQASTPYQHVCKYLLKYLPGRTAWPQARTLTPDLKPFREFHQASPLEKERFSDWH